jgi:hypothetical protein
VVPLASVPLDREDVLLAASGHVVATRVPGGETQLIDFGADGQVRTRRVEDGERIEPDIAGVLGALARAGRRWQGTLPAPARIDKQTVALAQRGALLIGTPLPAVQL